MNLKSFFSAICLAALCLTASYGQAPAEPQLTDYSQDFEGLTAVGVMGGESDLDMDGWVVNGLNFEGNPDAIGDFQFFYGNFAAPNSATNPAFSSIVPNQGTDGQGLQHLNIFSDYGERIAHDGTTNYVENRVLRQQIITTASVGDTVTFDFEFKRNFDGTSDFGPTGNTNNFAFVRVLNQLDGTFFTLVEDEFETTNADGATWATGQVTLTIDPSFDGQLLEFGFNTQCQNDNGSGILYDNLVFTAAAAPTRKMYSVPAGISIRLSREAVLHYRGSISAPYPPLQAVTLH